MAENPEMPIPEQDDTEARTRAAWLPWVVLALVVLVVLWLLRDYVAGPDVEPGTTRSKTITIKSAGGDTAAEDPEAAEEDSQRSWVPNVVGLTESEASDVLESAGFVMLATRVRSATERAGRVFEQTPGAYDPADPGTEVDVVVSLGSQSSETARVPDTIGLTIEGAKARVEDRGLVVRFMFQPKRGKEGIVYEQSPAPGKTVSAGTKVFMLAGERPGD